MSLLLSRIVDRVSPSTVAYPRHHDLLRTRAMVIDRGPDPARGERATIVSIALAAPSGGWITTADRGGLLRVVGECAMQWLGRLARGSRADPPPGLLPGWEDRAVERARREGVLR